ncbi:MAG TPA: HlyD family secretion protein [Bacteroidales bacterium]
MEHKTKKKQKFNRNRIVLIGLLTIGILFGVYKFIQSRKFVTTDDAQLETDISPLSARVSGYIVKVCFIDNQSVKMGDTLLMLDDRDLKIKVEQAEATLENAQATLESIRENSQSVKENGKASEYKIEEIKIRLANAKNELERNQKMLNEHAVTQQQFDKVKTEKEALEKQLETVIQQQKESNSKTGAASKQVNIAESTVKQRQYDLDYAKLQLSYTIVTAPFNGIVSKRNAVSGQLLQAGQPFCSIVASQKKWVVANFKETQLTMIKPGMKVNIEVDAYSGNELTGKVESFSSATGAKFSLIPPDNATGNFVKVVQRVPVKISLDTTNSIYKDLTPGMSVYVEVITK